MKTSFGVARSGTLNIKQLEWTIIINLGRHDDQCADNLVNAYIVSGFILPTWRLCIQMYIIFQNAYGCFKNFW